MTTREDIGGGSSSDPTACICCSPARPRCAAPTAWCGRWRRSIRRCSPSSPSKGRHRAQRLLQPALARAGAGERAQRAAPAPVSSAPRRSTPTCSCKAASCCRWRPASRTISTTARASCSPACAYADCNEFEAWLDAQRAALRQRRRQRLDARIDALEGDGRFAEGDGARRAAGRCRCARRGGGAPSDASALSARRARRGARRLRALVRGARRGAWRRHRRGARAS